MKERWCLLPLVVMPLIFSLLSIFSSAAYVTDIYFTISDTVFTTNESIVLKGYTYQRNTSAANSSLPLQSASVNLTIRNTNSSIARNYTFTTDSDGAFYSKSSYYPSATEVLAPVTSGEYYIRAQYLDPANATKFSEVAISVVNKTIDTLKISPEKAEYNPSELVWVNIEAVRTVGDKVLFVSNVTVNGSLRDSSKTSLQAFNCTTGSNGKCKINLTAPSTYGNYILELNSFKVFSAFSVVPFSYNLYMKDELGEALKNIFAISEQARIEVKINNASNSDSYTFSGYIADSAGNNVKTVTSTIMNSSNSFTNSFQFTVDAITFSYGAYTPHITVTKTGDGSITALTSFQVKDWSLSVDKKDTNSGFEYEYSTFINKTLRFSASVTYRSNGSVIPDINTTSFTVNLTDSMNNQVSAANVSWNSSCGKSGCYEFSINGPSIAGKYILLTKLSYSGDSYTDSRTINIVGGFISAQSTDKDGNIKELFGTDEHAYISLTSYNWTSLQMNLSNAEIFIVSYMNGSEFTYTQVDNFNLVNLSNSDYEWAWNSTSQRFKMDVPKAGGLYNVYISGNNKTLGTGAKFIVNPYSACSAAKDTAGQAGGTTGYYYVWQFKTTDTIYFEIKLTKANNPTGRATALNVTAGNSTGMAEQCTIDTTRSQVVSNATLTIIEVKNIDSGSVQGLNATDSVCQSSDTTGGYTCTVKPSGKWDAGQNIVKFSVAGQDGTTAVVYSKFEARSFYLYGWSQSWQNNPASNITLNLQMYEAGKGWWSGGSMLSGTVTLKRIEYMGKDGEWIWPPVNSGYNASNVNSTAITTSTGTLIIPTTHAPGAKWRTGNYRAVLQGTTTSGDTDYGYAWFSVKLWDAYGQPVECTASTCSYKNYFGSKENVTLYIKISKAGDNWWSWNYMGGTSLGGNVAVGVKKIQDCRTWPCKDLNSSQYISSTITVNTSSPGYWNGNGSSGYIISINKTAASWNSGWYSVILDINGTDTGYAWFNTIAFYVETQPTNHNGSLYQYSIRGQQSKYFNVSTTKSYKSWSAGARYDIADFINTTIDAVTLRTWDPTTYASKEYTYGRDLNVTPTTVNGTQIINISYTSGTWPTGYYYGEMTMKNSDNETSSGWLWFNVQPFRVQLNALATEVDGEQCINASLYVYDSDWSSSTPLIGNYSIIKVTENTWSGYSSSITNYTNYTTANFNSTANMTFCPNSGSWSGGSWGGYHYLNVLVQDNVNNDSQTGWLWFKTSSFQVIWNGGSNNLGNKATGTTVNVTVNLSKPSGGAASGNLTKIFQWRYDNYRNTLEEYRFVIGGCDSQTASQCNVTGVVTVTIYPPTGGWRVGYNYLQSEWTKSNDASTKIQDYSGIYFDGREPYNGWFSNYDLNNMWKYDFAQNENITIRLNVRDSNYATANVNITSVQYAFSGANCWSDYCRSYTTATYSPMNTSNGQAMLNIQVPSANWSRGYYNIRATVSGSAGTGTLTGGTVRIKDLTIPTMTLSTPTNNATYTTSIPLSATTNENADCYVYLYNYNNFNSQWCSGWNTTNLTLAATQIPEACNTTKYGYTGSTTFFEGVTNSWHHKNNDTSSEYPTTYMTTGGTAHSFTFNTSGWANQHYGLRLRCYDDDYNDAVIVAAFKVEPS